MMKYEPVGKAGTGKVTDSAERSKPWAASPTYSVNPEVAL